MQPLTTLLAILPLATALTVPRAGGPSIVPVPSNCPTTDPTNVLWPSTNGLKPSDDLLSTAVYSYYGNVNATVCAGQCFGWGEPGSCKSVLMAEKAPTPAGYYGSPGGVLVDTCMMFGREVVKEDLVPAEEGTYGNVRGINIGCQRSA